MNRFALTCLTALIGFALPALAVDGVIEINEARALAGGVTPGDAPGYPVTISQSGSYRLTGNLSQSNPTKNVIDIWANDVTLDLNGFTLKGESSCTRNANNGVVVCSNGGSYSGSGIDTSSSVRVVIRNGRIVGMANHGILAGGGTVDVDNVTVEHCDGYGLYQIRQVSRANARLNRQDGINAGYGMVTESLAENNGATGISCANCVGNIARSNLTGIRVLDGVAERNAVISNKTAGIDAGRSLVRTNVVYGNYYALTTTVGGVLYQGNSFSGYTVFIDGSAAGFVKSSDNFCNSVPC